LLFHLADPGLVLLNSGLVLKLLHRQFVDSLPRVWNVVAAVARPGKNPALHGLDLVVEPLDRGPSPGNVLGSDLGSELRLLELA
jgi:hypothetical protein